MDKRVLLIGAILAVSYLIGSVNFAIIVSRLTQKDDVRHHGSGSAGMTNMLRTYGKWPAAITFAGDFFKAAAAIALARWAFARYGVSLPLDAGYIAGIGVLMGHLFPLYFHFKGGKGVASSLGIMFCINPLVFVIIAVVFVPLVFITRIVSVGSVLGAAAYPIVTWIVLRVQGIPPLYDTLCACVIALVVLISHRANIQRLLNGTENRFGQKK